MGNNKEKEIVETKPYVILRASLPSHLADLVNKHIGWGYRLHGDTFREDGKWFQIVTKVD